MRKLALIALCLSLGLLLASPALAGQTDKTVSVPAAQWDAWLNSHRAAPGSAKGCECPKPPYPECPANYEKIGGMLMNAYNEIVDKWGSTQIFPNGMLEVTWRVCADENQQMCEQWKACTNCKPAN